MENHHFQWVNPLFQWQFSIEITTIKSVGINGNTMGQAVASTTAQPEPGTAARDAGALCTAKTRCIAVAFSMDPKRDVSNGF